MRVDTLNPFVTLIRSTLKTVSDVEYLMWRHPFVPWMTGGYLYQSNISFLEILHLDEDSHGGGQLSATKRTLVKGSYGLNYLCIEVYRHQALPQSINFI